MTITVDQYATYSQYDCRVNEKIRGLHLGNLNANNNYMFSYLRNRSSGYCYGGPSRSTSFSPNNAAPPATPGLSRNDYFQTADPAFTFLNDLDLSESSISLNQVQDSIYPVKKSGNVSGANRYYLILHIYGIDVEVQVTLPRSGITITATTPTSAGPNQDGPVWVNTIDNQILTSQFEAIEYRARAINATPATFGAALFAMYLEEAIVPATDMP